MKEGKKERRASFGNMVRRLSDITNFQPQTKSPSVSENSLPDFASSKDFVDHLVKEKMAMVKLIQDKNKIIELSGIEIQHLKACVHKMQLQNWNLAQSNSHMLAELNMGRKRMKELHHEIMCKEAILKTKNLSPKINVEVNTQKTGFQDSEDMNKEAKNSKDTNCCNAGRRRRLSRTRSLCILNKSNQHAEKEAAVGKRRCLRRQSGNSRIRNEGPTEHSSQIVASSHENKLLSPTPSSSPKGISPEVQAQKSSFVRPMRKAAERVGSYKERPINVKMRRSR